MENNNRIEFIVRREATKKDIKEAIETLLEVKVAKVNVRINKTGSMQAFAWPKDMMQRRLRSS